MTETEMSPAWQEWLAALEVDAGRPRESLRETMASLKAFRNDFHWVGVYVLDQSSEHLLVGPYVGPKTDHRKIPVGRGVCGTAVAEGVDQIVDDVGALDNYLACNLETKSEIVVLIRDSASGQVLGQIDIDSTKRASFSKQDHLALSRLAERLAPLVAAYRANTRDGDEDSL